MLRPRPKSCKTGKNLCAKEAVLSIRLPRILLACMVGGCLATAGTSYQSVFRNPMAAPDIWAPPPARASVQRYLGMMWLAKLLYPDATAQYDMYNDAHEYYELFYTPDLLKKIMGPIL